MKTLIRSIVVAALLTGLAGTAATVAAQRVVVDVRLGTPGAQVRQYRQGHRHQRQYHRVYLRHHRHPVIVREHSHRRSIVIRRWQRAHRPHYYRYY